MNKKLKTIGRCSYCEDRIYSFQSVKETKKGLMHSGCSKLGKK